MHSISAQSPVQARTANPIRSFATMEALTKQLGAPNEAGKGRVLLILLDDAVVPANRVELSRSLHVVRDQILSPNDWAGLFSTGLSSIEVGVTQQREPLDQAITRAANVWASAGALRPQSPRRLADLAYRTAYDAVNRLSKIPDRARILLILGSAGRFTARTGERSLDGDLINQLVRLGRTAEQMGTEVFVVDR